ncbi:hypothetical protein L596_010686 [Steinernema carpocapsae]|uniref:SET domain-containing protein n=1 Tax=Steinernema carpocapsae TaxID=34508 RepID=A0A4U5PJK7_STECR|nr:hypothetical protein L596_010686 [Steinernema carpocapsae]
MVNSSQTPNALTLSSNDPRHHIVRIGPKDTVEEGQELFVDYGFNLNNLELWMKHGFVFPENKHNSFVEIEPAELIEAAVTLQLMEDFETLDFLAPIVDGSLLTIIEDNEVCEDLTLSIAEILSLTLRGITFPNRYPRLPPKQLKPKSSKNCVVYASVSCRIPTHA